MKIRKLFRYEMSHRVLDAFTKRCSENIHGHSYVLELVFGGNESDEAQMLMDFGLVKKYFHPFVDSFDHAHMIWDRPEIEQEKKHIMSSNQRWIMAPFSSTAEMQAKMFFNYSHQALQQLKELNEVGPNVYIYSAIVHETVTGYAEYDIIDVGYDKFPAVKLRNIRFSNGIVKEWSKEFKSFYTSLVVSEH